ncbi:MAG: cupin domain-containing protein [Terriglobales bacterium]
MIKDAAYWIHKLELQPHPEGGYYRQTYKADLVLPQASLPANFTGPRPAATAIDFLLERGNFSAFHRLRSDELWHFYLGDALLVHVIEPDGRYSKIELGSDFESGQTLQAVVKAGCWFASEVASQTLVAARHNSDPFALVACTVSPGFDFEDFELAERAQLAMSYPQHRELIGRLTRL